MMVKLKILEVFKYNHQHLKNPESFGPDAFLQHTTIYTKKKVEVNLVINDHQKKTLVLVSVDAIISSRIGVSGCNNKPQHLC